MWKMYTLHVQSNTADTSALSGNEMPLHLSAGTHGRWPTLATLAQNKLPTHQRQRLHTYFPYSTPLFFFVFTFIFCFFSRFGAASEVICYIPRPFCPRFCEGKNKSRLNSLSSTTQPKPAASSAFSCVGFFHILWLHFSLNEHHIEIFVYGSSG